jgi:sodium pump decarboxylase gamma subunit
MLSEGLNLAMFGMSVVFIFLALLILLTKLMSVIVIVLDTGNTESSSGKGVKSSTGSMSAEEHAKLKAVLSVAVRQYKAKH